MKNVDLRKSNITSALLLFAVPIFMANLFQMLYNTADTVIVSYYLGDTSIAAIGAATPIYGLLVGFMNGIGNGMGLVMGRSYGADNIKALKKNVAAALVIGLVISILMVAFSELFMYKLLESLDTPAEVIGESFAYIRFIMLFIIIMYLYNLCASALRAVGDSTTPLIFLLISSVINIGLDMLFIIKFGMGIEGTAVATVIAQGISVVLCIVFILIKKRVLVPELSHFKYDGPMVRELLAQGLSMAMMMAIVNIGTVILQKAINNLGEEYMACQTIGRKIMNIFNLPLMAIATSLSMFVSQNKGANNRERIIKGVRTANLINMAYGLAYFLINLFFARYFVLWMSGTSNEVIIENGYYYMAVSGFFSMVLGVLFNTRHALQGLGAKLTPLVSSIIELIGKILFVAFIIPFWGYMGVVFCEPIIWCVMTVQLVWTYKRNSYIRGEEKAVI